MACVQVPLLCKILRSLLVSVHEHEHDVGGVTDPFLQVKVVPALAATVKRMTFCAGRAGTGVPVVRDAQGCCELHISCCAPVTRLLLCGSATILLLRMALLLAFHVYAEVLCLLSPSSVKVQLGSFSAACWHRCCAC